jgi:proline dehydrogenase
MLRALFIGLSESKSLRHFAGSSSIGQKMSRRFVPGTTVEEIVQAAEAVNRLGIRVSVDNLGENITSRDEALHSRDLYHQLLDEISKRKLDSNVSLKVTHMGLDIDEGLACEIVNDLLAHAVSIGRFIRIDMEGSPYTQRTIAFTRELHGRSSYQGHVGTVLQSYMRRTADDAKLLCSQGIGIRLCKGAYKEPPEIAFQAKSEVDANYISVAKYLLKSGIFHGLATHDERIIQEIKEWARSEDISPTSFEFQMLYGIRRDLQEALVKEGWGMRVYIPFGTEWYPYLMRRLAERPANLFFIAKNILRG